MRKGQSRIIRLPDINPNQPVQDQLTAHLRRLIHSGAIAAGARMPSQRTLSRDLKLSRNTVLHAYETLAAEGLLAGRHGAGTYVSSAPARVGAAPRRRSRSDDVVRLLPLQRGSPDLHLFPVTDWVRLQNRRWRALPASGLGYGNPSGWPGLRAILAQRVAAVRGIACFADQVHVVSSTTAALRLICGALRLSGRTALVESPGHPAFHRAFAAQGVHVRPMPVDEDGADVVAGLAATPDAQLVYVTPTSQFPTGAVMSPERRRHLLHWANINDRWIVENDYESDFVFEGAAPAPLRAENGAKNVIYVATINNVLFPSARIAFVVAPDALGDVFAEARALEESGCDIPRHMVAVDFMEAGHLASHIRRCRDAYAERRLFLRRGLAARFGDGVLRLAKQPLGLHVTAWLPAGWSDKALCATAFEQGLILHSISDGLVDGDPGPPRPGVVMGFAGFAPAVLGPAITRFARLMDKAQSAH